MAGWIYSTDDHSIARRGSPVRGVDPSGATPDHVGIVQWAPPHAPTGKSAGGKLITPRVSCLHSASTNFHSATNYKSSLAARPVRLRVREEVAQLVGIYLLFGGAWRPAEATIKADELEIPGFRVCQQCCMVVALGDCSWHFGHSTRIRPTVAWMV